MIVLFLSVSKRSNAIVLHELLLLNFSDFHYFILMKGLNATAFMEDINSPTGFGVIKIAEDHFG